MQKKYPYKNLVGGLMYLMVCTRPDLAFIVGGLCRYMDRYGEDHWLAAKRVLRYIKKTKNRRLCLGGGNCNLVGYSDASWQDDHVDFQSTGGYLFKLGEGTVTWRSYKQHAVADSTCEAEYISLADSIKEHRFLRSLLTDIGINSNPTPIFVDNMACTRLGRTGQCTKATRHIDRKYHIVRFAVQQGHGQEAEVTLHHIHTDDNPADLMTKALDMSHHQRHIQTLGLNDSAISISASASIPFLTTQASGGSLLSQMTQSMMPELDNYYWGWLDEIIGD
jgi:hypothetical protein